VSQSSTDADFAVQGHEPLSETVLLIDGDCVLCNRAAQFVIRHDKAKKIRLASLGSEAAAKQLAARDFPPPPANTFVFFDGSRGYLRSDAALRLAVKLGFPWSLAGVFLLLPRPLRDLGYRLVAENRYRWFGKTRKCALLSPEERSRFLPDGITPAPSAKAVTLQPETNAHE